MRCRRTLPAWHMLGTGARIAVAYRAPDGTEQTVPLAAAGDIAFEECLPARDIPHYVGQAHTPGDYWSATTGTLIGYESWLECKWMTLLDFDPAVTAFTGQPFTFHGIDADGPWEHTPDIFARRDDGSVLLLDVKNSWAARYLDVAHQVARTRAACDELDWDYGLFTEPDHQLWTTVQWLSGFRRHPHAGLEYLEPLRALARRPVRFGDLCLFAEIPELARPVLFHLCWQQQIVFDLTAPLRDATIVRTRTDECAYHVTAPTPTPAGEPS